jgi:hypothetical protein
LGFILALISLMMAKRYSKSIITFRHLGINRIRPILSYPWYQSSRTPVDCLYVAFSRAREREQRLQHFLYYYVYISCRGHVIWLHWKHFYMIFAYHRISLVLQFWFWANKSRYCINVQVVIF